MSGEGAGKGDAPRTVNVAVYRANYERINWLTNLNDRERANTLEHLRAQGATGDKPVGLSQPEAQGTTAVH